MTPARRLTLQLRLDRAVQLLTRRQQTIYYAAVRHFLQEHPDEI